MTLFIPRRKEYWLEKPNTLVEINWNNSLTEYLGAFYIAEDSKIIRDLAFRSLSDSGNDLISTGESVGTKNGLGLSNFNGVSYSYTDPGFWTNNFESGRTLIALVRRGNYASGSRNIFTYGASTGQGIYLDWKGAANTIEFNHKSSGGADTQIAASQTINSLDWSHLVARSSAGTGTINFDGWVNGESGFATQTPYVVQDHSALESPLGDFSNEAVFIFFSIFTKDLEDDVVKCLYEAPYQFLKQRGTQFYISVSGGTSVGLSGNSITSSYGNIGPQNTKELTGNASTISNGIVNSFNNCILTGNASTISKGVVNSLNACILSGNGLVASKGVLAIAIDRELAGQEITLSKGALTAIQGILVALTGQALTLDKGSIVSNLTKGLEGLQFDIAQGTITVFSNDVAIALTGKSLSTIYGALSPDSTIGLSGLYATVSEGLIDSLLSNMLSGQSVTLEQGNTSVTIAKGITGQGIISGNGLVVFESRDVSLSLTGHLLTTGKGTLIIEGTEFSRLINVVVLGNSYTILALDNNVEIISNDTKHKYLN